MSKQITMRLKELSLHGDVVEGGSVEVTVRRSDLRFILLINERQERSNAVVIAEHESLLNGIENGNSVKIYTTAHTLLSYSEEHELVVLGFLGGYNASFEPASYLEDVAKVLE